MRAIGFEPRVPKPGPLAAADNPEQGGLALVDLFNDFATLVDLLSKEVTEGHWLDAFLLAAGIHQLLEDELQRDNWSLRRAASYLSATDVATRRAVGTLARTADRAVLWIREAAPSRRRLAGAADEVGQLTTDLCAAALEGENPGEQRAAALRERTAALRLRGAETAPLDGNIVRLPSCFSSFDQRPSDVDALAREFSERWPNRRRPLTVVGVRTSGSYLGPIGAFCLRRLGYGDVTTVTLRPGWPVTASARKAVLRTATRRGHVLIVDDPPTTGRALATIVDALTHVGVPIESVKLLFATFAGQPPPPDLVARVQSVTLSWHRWGVQRQLEPQTVQTALSRLVGPTATIRRVQRLGSPTRPSRDHVRAGFVVETPCDATGGTRREIVVAEGVGLGYMGRHALAVARALPGLVPEVIGFADGILYRHWAPEAWRCARGNYPRWAGPSIAAHIAERGRLLRVQSDRSQALAGRQPTWEVAAAIVSQSLGRLAGPLRLALVDPLVREVLEVDSPCVIDGSTGLDGWFTPGPGRTAIKIEFAGGAFSHLDLASYDPVSDLAGVAVSLGDPSSRQRLKAAYEAHSRSPVDPERWMLHQLVQVWHRRRLNGLTAESARRMSAQALQTYFAERYLDGIDQSGDGPFCALDLDGVLETSSLGFPALTSAGALALRALLAHGYRPLIATGRSLSEVVERCAAYALPGGVAEYGAVVYDHHRRRTVDLLPDDAEEHLCRLRAAAAEAGLRVDPDYARVVRVWRDDESRSSDRHRRGLEREEAARLLLSSATRSKLVAVTGDEQTDFVPAGVDKGRGLAILLDILGGPSGQGRPVDRPLALAVGDSPADASFLGMAHLALAPANAQPALIHYGVSRLSRRYQAGAAQAVGYLIGHQPGSCPQCRPSIPPGPASGLISLLSFQEAGWRDSPIRLVHLSRRGLARVAPG